jgi:dTDP-4-dehydrorhamnose 3,5-epimerase
MNDLTNIDGVTIHTLKQLADDRGSVLQMLSVDTPDFNKFGECYFSEVIPGAIKAWKLHRDQTQNFAVPVGRIRLVIFDDRESSKTRGNLKILELGRPDAYFRVKIPPDLWYGFACIGETLALLVNCADLPHDPSESERRPISDSSIPYDW